MTAGPGRGWAPELAAALTGPSPVFQPKDARSQGVPDMLSNWATEGEASAVRLGLVLEVPPLVENGGASQLPTFGIRAWVGPLDDLRERVPVEEAWKGGAVLTRETWSAPHPAYAVMRSLARAARLHPALDVLLAGPSPSAGQWTPAEAWTFLRDGVPALRDAGFDVEIPKELEVTGDQRLRARLRLSAPLREDGSVDLSRLLDGQWEIVLGDLTLSAAEFAKLHALGDPLVPYGDRWVILDPNEIARLPAGWNEGHREHIPASEALRAVLTGELDGVPVVADQHLSLVIEALRNPPPQEVPPDLDAVLRPYQLHGYSWLATLGDLGLGACLADDMGLGKTVQAIAYLLRRKRMQGKKRSPSLVICPTSVLGNWQREIERFAPKLQVVPHHGARRDPEEFANSDVVITTYGLLVRDREELGSIKWDCLILDEAQAIKNPDSQRARSARGLTARHRISLSGTPVENRLDELWSLMEFLVPGLLGPRARFQREVAVPIERFGDQEMARRLKLGVSPFLLRRMKTDPTVISDLPDKIERNEYCPLTAEQARLYRSVVEDHLEKIAEAADIERRGLVLSMLTRLKQVCNHPAQYLIATGADPSEVGRLSGRSGKLERCEELVGAIVDNNERALIFTQYTEMGQLLCRHLTGLLDEDVPFLHGGTPQKRRDELVREFQEEESASPILVVSLRAGGTGLNLTRATHVIHYDRWWNPAIEDQATDRAYRIGQRRDVLVHKLVTVGTLEERIDQRMAEKRQLAESVVGVGERWITELDDNALRMLVTLGEDAVVEGS
ncbi:MAG: DEAD/DEAH box helicase [Deltaproteobacteria bacterium]|nr:DEAD/DEAH box helicase [Deltaproteobacteria bacterium]